MEYHRIAPIIMEYHGILKIPGHNMNKSVTKVSE